MQLNKNCKLQFFQHFRRLYFRPSYFAREKLGATTRARIEKGESLTLHAGLELDKLSGVGSENRVTCSRDTLTTLNLGKSFHGVQLPRGTLT